MAQPQKNICGFRLPGRPPCSARIYHCVSRGDLGGSTKHIIFIPNTSYLYQARRHSIYHPTTYVIHEWSPQLTLPYLCVVISVILPSYYDIFFLKTPPKKKCPCFWTICQNFFNFCHFTPVNYNIFFRFSHPKNLSPLLRSHFFYFFLKTPPLLKNIKPET